MNRLIFVLGGARSGKSGFAMEAALNTSDSPLYIATASADDPEMADRIQKHKSERGANWRVLEVPLDLPGKAVRLNISLDEHLVEQIDRAATAQGQTRSGFLAEAAKSKLRGVA